MKRRVLLSLAIISGIAVSGLWLRDRSGAVHEWAHAPAELQGLIFPQARAVADFDLQTQHGEHFGRAQLLGHWSLIYFGYLQCPDVCPTTLQSLGALRKLLRETQPARPVQMLFVSVDPDNDTPERIGAYLGFFDPELIGLGGDPAQLAGALGVMYAEHVDESGVRSVDHTTSIMLIDPQGRGLAALPGPHQPQTMLQQLRKLWAYFGDGPQRRNVVASH
jgi:protein SCO1